MPKSCTSRPGLAGKPAPASKYGLPSRDWIGRPVQTSDEAAETGTESPEAVIGNTLLSVLLGASLSRWKDEVAYSRKLRESPVSISMRDAIILYPSSHR